MDAPQPKPISFAFGLFLAALGGLAQALTLPGPNLWPLVFICLIPLAYAIRRASAKQAFFFGWAYGLVLGLVSFSWLEEVMAGYGGLGPGGVVVLILLAAFLGSHQGLWALLMAHLKAKLTPYRWALVGGVLWVGFDHLKNWIFTGFNWSPLALGLSLEPRLMGAADLIGLYGLGAPLAAINLWLSFIKPKNPQNRSLAALSLAVLLVIGLYGFWSFTRWEKIGSQGPVKKIAILQASVEQEMKWDVAYRDRILARYELLFHRAQRTDPWLILWSETAAPFAYGYDQMETTWLNALLAQSKATSLVGVTRAEFTDGAVRQYNRAWLMGPKGPGPYYDKRHLVPFGEYLPLAGRLPILRSAFFQGVVGAAGTFSHGEATEPLVYEGVTLGVMICFESIFPYMARDRVLEGAKLLLVTTNDAWFGASWAPEQHLRQAAYRAVESRRPLARAANNGISANIRPSGRILESSPQNEVETYVYSIHLLPEENQGLTFFVLFGYWLAPLSAALAVILLFRRLYFFFKGRSKTA
ncbi:MAG: apolipoprotein N-acyltransferase [Deltaproteobacteria bacterium]|jgi:apolipoprotein N-acyltransferase|nr:apolipoprotein N-acyltransferase [Deltaproteobacteria bacterium]